MKKPVMTVSALLISVLTFSFANRATALPVTNARISIATAGTQANADSAGQSPTSQDGRYTVFSSSATNLVSGDTNGKDDIFIRDNNSSTTTRVSVDSSGNQSNGHSNGPRISPNGEYIVYASEATNLVAGDTNAMGDVFLYKVSAATTELISKSTGGAQGNYPSYYPDVTGDGRFVSFISYSTNLDPNATTVKEQVYLRDRTANTLTLVTQTTGGTAGNGDTVYARISCSGRFIAFTSASTNLDGTDTNGYRDVFVADMLMTKSIKNITKSSNGGVGTKVSISCDGNYLAFDSNASNLVGSDTNGKLDVFRYDIQNASVARVSLTTAGAQTYQNSRYPDISGDGSIVVFTADDPASGSGFYASDTNGYDDIFMRDITASTTSIVSINSSSVIADRGSQWPSVSTKGTKITFDSNATNLVSGDTNSMYDNFMADTTTANTCNY